jgi:putative Holliday junction resolvase
VSRVAAVDYGRRRIGLAVSDPLRLTVRGLSTIERGPDLSEAARAVAKALKEAGAALVLVGLPLHEDGRESEMSREARRFGEALGAAAGLPVEYVDEGLTSWEAEESLKGRKKPLRDARRAGEVDREAARAILLSWLRERPLPPAAPPPA